MNRRTRTHILLSVTAAALCSSAAVCNADPRAAMNECVQAFVSTALPKDQPIRVRTPRAAATRSIPRGQPYAIALTAISRTSGKQLATATCSVDSNGTLTALDDKPLPNLSAADTKTSGTSEQR